jgi:hypothetical protein
VSCLERCVKGNCLGGMSGRPQHQCMRSVGTAILGNTGKSWFVTSSRDPGVWSQRGDPARRECWRLARSGRDARYRSGGREMPSSTTVECLLGVQKVDKISITPAQWSYIRLRLIPPFSAGAAAKHAYTNVCQSQNARPALRAAFRRSLPQYQCKFIAVRTSSSAAAATYGNHDSHPSSLALVVEAGHDSRLSQAGVKLMNEPTVPGYQSPPTNGQATRDDLKEPG